MLMSLSSQYMSSIEENVSLIMSLDGNNKCGDCGIDIDRNNGWASITFGIIICVECAGVHRGIAGNQIRSFFLDDKAWKTDDNINFFRQIGGNHKINNNVWECHLPLFHINPKTDTFQNKNKRHSLRDFFIKSKYAHQLFIPLSSKEYTDTKRNPSITKMPISPIQTSVMYVATSKNDMKWSKKPQYLLLHSFFLSIYSLNKLKRNKCDHLQTFNLISLKLTIGHGNNDENDEDEWVNDYDEFYTFTITPNDHSKPLLKCKCDDFDQFIKYVHQIRKTILYYKMYSKLIDINMKKKQIDLNLNYQYFMKENIFIGIGKLFGGKSSYFYIFNNKLFTFHNKPIENGNMTIISAKRAYDMQQIDIIPDVNGERSGFKYALLLIEPYQMIAIKFETQQDALVFYSKLFQSYINIRGSYLVDFKYKIPIIVDVEDDNDENNENKNNNSTPGQLQDINDKNDMELNRVRLKSLDRARPPEILEILAKMDEKNNENKENNEYKKDEKENEIENENKSNNNDSMILRMKKMADQMSEQLKQEQEKSKKTIKGKNLLLKLSLNDGTYITLPIKKNTTANDIINKVITRRHIDTNKIEVKLNYDNTKTVYEILETNANNHKIEIIFKDKISEEKPIKKPKSNVMLIKLFIDNKTYVTVPILPNTKQSDVIKKIIKRRNIDINKMKCILYFEENELTDDDNLYDIISKHSNNISKIKIELFDIDSDGNIIKKHFDEPINNQKNKHEKQIPSQILSINAIGSDTINIESLYEDESKSPKSPMVLSQSISNPADHDMQYAQWSCNQCTFLNNNEEEFCRICGAPVNNRMNNQMNNNNNNNNYDRSDHKSIESNMMMTYHFQEYQKLFQQLHTNPNNLSFEQIEKSKIMAQYHFQNYTMMYELIKIQNEMSYLQAQTNTNTNTNTNAMSMNAQPPMARQMQYLKLERYFLMNDQQQETLTNKFNEIQQSLIKYATITIVEELKEFGINNCFRLIIPSDIPLPKRKEYWQNVLKISRTNMGLCEEYLM